MTFASPLSRAALLCAGLIALCASAVRGQGVAWLGDYNAARREAHDKNLPLVIDFSTQNCVWCRKLEATTFRDPAVVKVLSERFIALHVDGEKDAVLAKNLNIKGYPTLIFADPDGNVLARQDGYMTAAEFGQQLDRVLASVRPIDPGVRQAVHLSGPHPEEAAANPERSRRAAQLLTLAQADFRDQRFLGCLERCKTLKTDYADLSEGAEAQRLEAKIRTDPDQMRLACDNLTDRLGEMYLDLAEAFLRKEQPDRAMVCLEWVMQACPGTPQADAARGRLAQVKERVVRKP